MTPGVWPINCNHILSSNRVSKVLQTGDKNLNDNTNIEDKNQDQEKAINVQPHQIN